MYFYNVEVYSCDFCNYLSGGTIANSQALTVGKWYYDPVADFKIKITSSAGCGGGSADRGILDSSKQDDCASFNCI
jgi:hypothetical protein